MMVFLPGLSLAQAPPEAPRSGLVVETFNVGLAHGFVDYAPQRTPAIIDALSRGDADVICLQEAWNEEDRAAISSAMDRAGWSHQIVSPIEQQFAAEAPACGIGELFGEDRFVSCLTGTCGDTEGDAQTNCVIDHCGPALTQLKNENRDCAQALMAQVGSSAPVALWTVLRPFWNAGTFAYGGGDGLMLLSKRPLGAAEPLDFTDISTLNRRRALVGTVPHDGAEVTVVCTHLSADLTKIAPYPGAFPSWADENLAQVDRLLTFAASRPGPIVLAGDFNCGRADPANGLIGEAEPSCRALVDAGFADPSADHAPVECTWCTANLLNLEGGEHDETVIDHLFLRGLDVLAEGRTKDGPVEVRVEGTTKQTSLSDHFGYAATLALPLPPAPAAPPVDGPAGP